MNIKNVRKIADDEYVIDLEHPKLGWIPFTVLFGSNDELQQELTEELKKNHIKDAKIDLDIVKGRTKADIIEALDSKIMEFEKKYSEKDINSWSLKRNEAEKVLNGETSIILSAETEISGEDVTVLASKIIDKSNLYNSKLSIASELKKKYVSFIETSKSEKDLNAVKNDFEKALKKYFGEKNA